MSIWLRTLWMVLAALFRPRLALFDRSQLTFRVMPDDLDFNIHMNNARYLAIMDIGRTDLILRTGMWRALAKNHWQPVLAGSLIRFRRPLQPFQRFDLQSKLIGWDEKWLYIEHRIARGDVLASHAVVRAAFVGAAGVVPPLQLARLLGHQDAAPVLPGWVAAWRDAERAMDSGAVPAKSPFAAHARHAEEPGVHNANPFARFSLRRAAKQRAWVPQGDDSD